ncbi:hypothetical protein ATCVNTS1_491L [Acanthocystis turfacea Chlorella virus NTS-1]|nr:hypothetical protein ATCVNTS1_491L [Acanthocystis turfacea Chlorella virus NTS-1]
MKQVIGRVKRKGVSDLEARRLEREKLLKMKRQQRSRTPSSPSPMNVNRRSPVASPVLKAAYRRRSVSPGPARASTGGISKAKRTIIKNSEGKKYGLTKIMPAVQTRAKKCDMVYTAKQEGAICWFSAIFTTLFYSQYTRSVVYKHATSLMRSTNPAIVDAAGAMKEILKGYEVGKVSARVVNHMQPKQFLAAIRKINPRYFTSNPDNTEEAHYGPYQHAMFAFLRAPHLSVGYYQGNLVFSGFNVNLPISGAEWAKAMKTSSPVGDYVDVSNPEVILIHRDAGEDYLQGQWGFQPPKIGRLEGHNPNEHSRTIRYNGRVYVLDSCVIGAELKTNACSMGHAVAGVTCNGERFVYNGWTAKSADRAMKGASGSVVKDYPCALGRYDWQKNKNFVINTGACRFQNATNKNIGKSLIFNAVQRSTVTYIRSDLIAKAVTKARLIRK